MSLQQDHWGCEMGMHPSVLSSLMTCYHLPWCGILPLNQRGTLAAERRVALFPQCISKELQGTTKTTTELN